MKIVGDQLEGWALSRDEDREADLFGRSAFNRYYYAAFLITRQMLGELNSSWRGTAHKEIPNLLKTSVQKSVKTQLNKYVRNNIYTSGERSRLLTKHSKSSNELAGLLNEAYQVRIVADYEPEINISKESKVISLDNYKLTTAKTWPDKANAYCKTIRSVWEEVGLA